MNGGEQCLDLGWREHRGRLVEQQHVGAAVEHLDDFDPLTLADGEVRDQRSGVDRETEPLADLGHSLFDVTPIENSRLVRIAEHHVLGDRESIDEPEVLVHHADAVGEAVARAAQPDRCAVAFDMALIGPVQAAQHRRQGALAGSVLAEDRVDLAASHGEVDGVGGEHAGKSFGDVDGSDRCRLVRARARTSLCGG